MKNSIKILTLFVVLSSTFVGCSQKQLVKKTTPHHKVSVQKSHKLILPYSKDIYSVHKYSRFFYQNDCNDIEFRIDDLYKNELKYDPIDVVEALGELDKKSTLNRCK